MRYSRGDAEAQGMQETRIIEMVFSASLREKKIY